MHENDRAHEWLTRARHAAERGMVIAIASESKQDGSNFALAHACRADWTARIILNVLFNGTDEADGLPIGDKRLPNLATRDARFMAQVACEGLRRRMIDNQLAWLVLLVENESQQIESVVCRWPVLESVGAYAPTLVLVKGAKE